MFSNKKNVLLFQMPYDQSAYVRGTCRGGGQRRARQKVKRAQKRPNPSETPKPAPKMKCRPQRPIKLCREEQSHMRWHVIQAHLPAGFAGTGMELAQRMASLEQFLQVARDQLKCHDNGKLMNKVLKDHIYPDTSGMMIHESEEDHKMM